MACSEAHRVHEYLDHELDASGCLAVERHLATCQECAALLQDLEAQRRSIRAQVPYFRADDALQTRIASMLDHETGGAPAAQRAPVARSRSFWTGAAGGASLMALVATLAFMALRPVAPTPLLGDLVDAHVRSLLADHLLDVASSSHHTVKPWFAGHADFSPPVADFADAGYSLVGGRVDYFGGRRAAVTVYRHGLHVINVFAWPADADRLPDAATLNGYHLLCWRNGSLAMCAVSDTAPAELARLRQLIQTGTSAAP